MGQPTYGSNSQQSSSAGYRRTWDTEEFAAKAKQKDDAAREYAKAAEKARQQGKRPPRRKDDDLPHPTQAAKAREGSLELDKNQGKTMVVSNPSGRGPGAPGYYCDCCNRTYKDSASFLDHLNSRSHLKKLGQKSKAQRSTLDQVRIRIAEIREKSRAAAQSKAYDFEERLKDIRKSESEARKEKRAARKNARLAKQQQQEEKNLNQPATEDDATMMAAMGFSGFK